MRLALIMLAAGNSRRFGSNKLLYPIEGIPMYLRTLELLKQVREALESGGICCSVTVVTQYREIEEQAVMAGAEVLMNPHPEQGIASSLQIGLRANQEADACLFTVSDQPWLKAETVIALVEQFLASQRGIACLAKGERLGNPCLFTKPYYPELLALKGDTGGKRVILAHMEDTFILQAAEERQLKDVDTCSKTE